MSQAGHDPKRLTRLGHKRRLKDDVESHEFELQVPADLRWLRGHFENNPILPAIVELNEVLFLSREIWPDLAGLRGIPRAKFRTLIRPNESLLVRLSRRRGRDTVSFEILRSADTCSEGALEFESPRR